MKSKKSSEVKYKVKQNVVYPMQGVGSITEIVEKQFQGSPTLYYVIYLESPDMTVMLPCNKAKELGIRAVVSKRTANEALKNLEKPSAPTISDWKQRHQNNIDLLKSGTIYNIATVVAALYFRSKLKELPIMEKKQFDSAKKQLIDELSISLNKSTEDIENMIFSKLEQTALENNLIPQKTRKVDPESNSEAEEDFESIEEFKEEE